MWTIGMCGGSGSGKGILASVFAEYGVPSLDTDAVYHEMISGPSPCTEELCQAFSSHVRKAEGGIDRAKLRELVFSSEEKLKLLNRITHRHVLHICDLWLQEQEKQGRQAAIIDAPLLYESGYYKKCDRVIVVYAEDDLRIARIMERDGISEAAAKERLRHQTDPAILRSIADYWIDNNKSKEELREKAKQICNDLQISIKHEGGNRG